VLLRYPRLRTTFERLAGRISAGSMRAMNYAADVEHRDVRAIVEEFLAGRLAADVPAPQTTVVR
jgi:glycine betaine/choline ABC-type transport system substrate-binding protein